LSRFRDDAEFYKDNGAQLLGISIDSIHAQRAFSERLGGLPYPLLPDFNKEVFPVYSGFYDNLAGMKGVGRRAVYVVDRGGIIRYKWIADAPGQQPDYEAIQKAVADLK
jgi:glutaredoxin-dependent peroxiredoxin